MARKWKYREGDIVETKHGNVKILECIPQKLLSDGRRIASRVTVQFIESGWVCTIYLSNLIAGHIKDRLARDVYGVGYVGTDMHIPHDNASVPYRAYRLWHRMMERCYKGGNNFKTYEGCTVSQRWQCFKHFYDDLPNLEGFDKWVSRKDMQLDKDIKVKGNKVYSLETCMFVTQSENSAECQKRRWENEAANTENQKAG